MLGKFFGRKGQSVHRMDLSTDAGMLGVWDYASFSIIHDYDSWDAELCEDVDIQRHIKAGEFIPLNLGDGAFGVEIRFGSPDSMSEREKKYLLVPGQPYLLRTKGKVCVSGIEAVSGELRPQAISLDVDPGDYAVLPQLIDWNQEPGAVDENDAPTANALPDIIVYLAPPIDGGVYRTELETFRKEDALR